MGIGVFVRGSLLSIPLILLQTKHQNTPRSDLD